MTKSLNNFLTIIYKIFELRPQKLGYYLGKNNIFSQILSIFDHFLHQKSLYFADMCSLTLNVSQNAVKIVKIQLI